VDIQASSVTETFPPHVLGLECESLGQWLAVESRLYGETNALTTNVSRKSEETTIPQTHVTIGTFRHRSEFKTVSATSLNSTRQVGNTWVMPLIPDLHATTNASARASEVNRRTIGLIDHTKASLFDDVSKRRADFAQHSDSPSQKKSFKKKTRLTMKRVLLFKAFAVSQAESQAA
jgi:hypothetical protein